MKYSLFWGSSLLLAGATELIDLSSRELQLISCLNREVLNEPQVSRVNFCRSKAGAESVELLSNRGFGLPVHEVEKIQLHKMTVATSEESFVVETPKWILSFEAGDPPEYTLALTSNQKIGKGSLPGEKYMSMMFVCSVKAVDHCNL